mgnify:CR=1 FL=1
MVDRYSLEEMKVAHNFTHNNFSLLQEKQNCRCIYCLQEFISMDIIDFTLNDTALYPFCGLDAVIGEKSGFKIDKEEAELFYDYFFNSGEGQISNHILDLEIEKKFKMKL